jgi:hypothetical protein
MNAAPFPFQQGRVERVLHRADSLARGCQRHVRATGSMRDAAGLGDVQEQLQVGQIKA